MAGEENSIPAATNVSINQRNDSPNDFNSTAVRNLGNGNDSTVDSLPFNNESASNGAVRDFIGVSQTNSAQVALQRGLETLKGAEIDPSMEEMRKLDSQIDHFNSYLDKFEAINKELNQKLNTLLETQKQEALKRRASLQKREAENKEQSDALHNQMRALLNRCHLARRATVAEIPSSAERNGALTNDTAIESRR